MLISVTKEKMTRIVFLQKFLGLGTCLVLRDEKRKAKITEPTCIAPGFVPFLEKSF